MKNANETDPGRFREASNRQAGAEVAAVRAQHRKRVLISTLQKLPLWFRSVQTTSTTKNAR